MFIASMITIVGLGLEPMTLHIYDQKHQQDSIVYKTDSDLPSVVAWKKMSRELGLQSQINQERVPDLNAELLKEFHKIGLPEKDGLALLLRAKEILGAANFPCAKVIPIVANDPEEEMSYLTLRLYVNASMEKAFELDSALTKDLISSFAKLPVRLSFSVYENESEAV